MPEIVKNDAGKYCLEGYGDADACYDSEDEAKAAQAKLSMSKEASGQHIISENWYTPEAQANLAIAQKENERLRRQEDAEQALLERLWNGIKARLGVKSDGDEATGFKVVGNHWFLTWTNNFKDRDQQWFPEREIKAYVQRVNMGTVPLPELWIWHGVKGRRVRVGEAEQVDGHGHFGIAAGVFDDTPMGRKAREFYANPKNANETRVSHGFTYPTVGFDGKHFRQFNTFEISLLPKGAEANLYTSLEGVKAMELSPVKRAYYEKIFGKDEFEVVLANLDEKGKALEELGAEFKDFPDVDVQADANKQAVENADQAFKELVPNLMEGSAEAVKAALEAIKLVKAHKAATDAQIATLQREVAETKALVEQRPRASQSAQTVVETSHLSAEMQKQLKEQNTVRDSFWGTEVPQTP